MSLQGGIYSISCPEPFSRLSIHIRTEWQSDSQFCFWRSFSVSYRLDLSISSLFLSIAQSIARSTVSFFIMLLHPIALIKIILNNSAHSGIFKVTLTRAIASCISGLLFSDRTSKNISVKVCCLLLVVIVIDAETECKTLIIACYIVGCVCRWLRWNTRQIIFRRILGGNYFLGRM